jgi:hypothetical protein
MTNAIFYSLITCQITCVTTAPADRLHKVTRFLKNICYNALLRTEEKSAIAGKALLPGKPCRALSYKIGALIGMLELLTWVNQFFSFHLFILRVLYFFPAGSFMDRNKFTSFFLNIVRKIDAFIFLDVVIVIFVICLHFDSLIDILTNATSSSAMSL